MATDAGPHRPGGDSERVAAADGYHDADDLPAGADDPRSTTPPLRPRQSRSPRRPALPAPTSARTPTPVPTAGRRRADRRGRRRGRAPTAAAVGRTPRGPAARPRRGVRPAHRGDERPARRWRPRRAAPADAPGRAVFTPGSARPDPDAVRAAQPDDTHDTADPAAAQLDGAQAPSTGAGPAGRRASGSRPRRAGGGPAGRPERRAGGGRRSRRRRSTSRLRTQRRTTPHRRRRSVTTAGPAAPVSGPGPPPGRSPPPDRTARIATCPRRPLPTRRSPTRTGQNGRSHGAVPADAGGGRPHRRPGRTRHRCPSSRSPRPRGTTAHGTTAHGTTGRQDDRHRSGRRRRPSASTIRRPSASTSRLRSARPQARPVRRERAGDLRAGRSAAVAAAARARPGAVRSTSPRPRRSSPRSRPPGSPRTARSRSTGSWANGPTTTCSRRARRSRRPGPGSIRSGALDGPDLPRTGAGDGSGRALLRHHRGRGMAGGERRDGRASGRADRGRPAEATPACPPRPGQCRICGAGRTGLADAQRRERPRSARQLPARSTAGPGDPAPPRPRALRFPAGVARGRHRRSGERRARRGIPMTGPTGPVHTAPAGSSPARCSKEGA